MVHSRPGIGRKRCGLGVQSRHLLDRVEDESFGLDCPAFADEFVGREAPERLQSSPEIVGIDEVREMPLQLGMIVIMVSFDGRVLDGPVHAFDLPICPRMFDLRASMLDAVLEATHAEHVHGEAGCRSIGISGWQAKLDTVVGQDRVNLVRHRFDESDEESRGCDAFAFVTSCTKANFDVRSMATKR